MRDFISIPVTDLLLPAVASFIVAVFATPLVLKWASANKLFGPMGNRHIHATPTVRLGGLAIFASIALAAIVFLGVSPAMAGFYLGLMILVFVGALDDIYDLPPITKLVAQILAAATLIFFGNTITAITNPFGGIFQLSPALDIATTVIWVVLIINSINFLDGMDGLASGVSAIAAATIALVSLFAIVNQPQTAQLAMIVFGAAAGFLLYNWHPAKLFMGDSGSHTLGFALAAISILSGSKLATAALVLGLPIIDLLWAAMRRIRAGKSPWTADRNHLHHHLMDRGLSQRQIVGLLYLFAFLLGAIALAVNTWWKIAAFAGAIVLAVLLISLSRRKA